MALIKTLSRFGYDASYIRLTRIDRFDFLTRECVVIFSLYKDKATRETVREPFVPSAARLVLSGAKFDQYFGKGKLDGKQFFQVIYDAVKTEAADSWAGKLTFDDAADDI